MVVLAGTTATRSTFTVPPGDTAETAGENCSVTGSPVGTGVGVGPLGVAVEVAVDVFGVSVAEITARDSPDPGVARMNVFAPVPLSPPSMVRLRVAPVALNAEERSAVLALERLKAKYPCWSTPLIRVENGALVKLPTVRVA